MTADAFEAELMRRSPLAACVLEVSDFALDDALLTSVWDAPTAGGATRTC